MIKIFLIIAVVIQTIATVYALRLVWATKYNAIWILFIIGFVRVIFLVFVLKVLGVVDRLDDEVLDLALQCCDLRLHGEAGAKQE